LADEQGSVTIIFCDICDFDTIVKEYQNTEMVGLLDHVFNAFDQLCEQRGLQKIETVGKTYMAAGGLKLQEELFDQALVSKDPNWRMVEYAFDILNFVEKTRLKDGRQLKVKIGIHTGPCISGVLGSHKPQFSLIGDTVNTSSRVCAKGMENSIHISKVTHAALQKVTDIYTYQQRMTFMKGLGDQETYLVGKRRQVRAA